MHRLPYSFLARNAARDTKLNKSLANGNASEASIAGNARVRFTGGRAGVNMSSGISFLAGVEEPPP
jgi:hypothetical protein